MSGCPEDFQPVVRDAAEAAVNPDALEGCSRGIACIIVTLALLCTRNVCLAYLC
jgi:hypothetical protein